MWNEAAGLCRATGTPARPSRYFIDGALSLLTVGMATLTFFRLTRWAGLGAVAATVSVVALRNAAVILNHAVTIGVSAILFGHTNTRAHPDCDCVVQDNSGVTQGDDTYCSS